MITSKMKIYKPRLRLLAMNNVHISTGKLKQKLISISKCYKLLDVAESCSDDELKECYLKLVKSSHPDRDSQSADVAKFVEIQSAYNKIVEHRKTLKAVENESEEEAPSKYKMPQHRQYLEYNVGSGTPAQRLKQHQQQKFSDALENLADHHLKQAKLSQEDALMQINVRRTQKSMVRNAIDRLVEDLISESMKRGEFDNLSGLGKPLEARYKKENPYIDTTTYNLNKILINNGYVPNWVTLEKEIRESYTTAKIAMVSERLRILTLKDSKPTDQKKSLEKFRADLKLINKQIDRFNILAPSMVQQLFHYNTENEIDGISKLSVDGLEKSLFQLRSLSCPEDGNVNSSDKNNKKPSKRTDDSTSFKDVWKEWLALFSGSD